MTTIEAPGWGDPGTIRHSELIGHTVWVVEHTEERSEEVTAGLTVQAVLERPEMCPNHNCVRTDHPIYEQHMDEAGRPFFSGETP